MRPVPLRVKLTVLLLALLVAGLGFVGVIGVWMLDTYLVQRVDRQIDLTGEAVSDDTLVLVREPVGRGEGDGLGDPAEHGDSVGRGDPAERDDPLGSGGPDEHAKPAGGYRSVLSGRPVDRLPPPAIPATAPTGGKLTVPAVRGPGTWRIQVTEDAGGRRRVIAVDLGEVDAVTDRLSLILLLAGAGVVAIVSVVAVTVVRRSLQPLEAIGDTADAVAAGDLSRRVPTSDPRTETGRLGSAFNAMIDQVEASFRTQEESQDQMRRFVADASHELRTPLTAIRGFAELALEHPDLDPVALMRRVEAAASRMSLLVDDLLLLARVDLRPELTLQPVDLRALAADAVQETRLLAPDREITFSPGSSLAPVVAGDETRLRQVIANLLSNARLHTPAGTPITVRVGTSEGRVAFLEVADRGAGLTAEQARRVFDRFYRTAQDGGTGLGLAIVHALVVAHGGSVGVESVPGAGSTFRMELPLLGDG
ncbi:MAG: HAMP domain-containing histidine kinase [Thermoactinospora sp.]|nr:HAMP domain-containing histidine kinase [Thermoactinospora sp.]